MLSLQEEHFNINDQYGVQDVTEVKSVESSKVASETSQVGSSSSNYTDCKSTIFRLKELTLPFANNIDMVTFLLKLTQS